MAFSERAEASIALDFWYFLSRKSTESRFSSNNLPGVYPSEIILPRRSVHKNSSSDNASGRLLDMRPRWGRGGTFLSCVYKHLTPLGSVYRN